MVSIWHYKHWFFYINLWWGKMKIEAQLYFASVWEFTNIIKIEEIKLCNNPSKVSFMHKLTFSTNMNYTIWCMLWILFIFTPFTMFAKKNICIINQFLENINFVWNSIQTIKSIHITIYNLYIILLLGKNHSLPNWHLFFRLQYWG